MRATVDPRERARDQARRAREVVRDNQDLFRPFADAFVHSVRSGGRVLLLGEGRLHALAEYIATAVIGRDEDGPPHLAVDPIPLDPAGAQATARCIGPFDVLVGLSERCEDPFFRTLLDAAASRGAKVLALCVGPSRLEGRAQVAVDLPEPRAYRVAGLLSTVLHYIGKIAIAELRANPLMRPSRLDEGPRRQGDLDASGQQEPWRSGRSTADGEPGGAGGGGPPRGLPDQRDEPTITLDLPEDAFDIAFVDEELGPEVFSGKAAAAKSSGRLPQAAPPPAGAERGGPASGPASPPTNGGAAAAGSLGSGSGASTPSDASVSASAAELADSAALASSAAGFEDLDGLQAFDSLDDDELLHPTSADGTADASELARPGVGRVVMFRCKRCREALLADPGFAGTRAQCPFCGRRVKVPTSRGRPFRTGKSPLAQGARKVALRYSSEECRLSIMPHGGFPIEARLSDVTPEGVEATIRKEDAAGLGEGQPVRLRLVATAFLEPLVAVAQLERIVADVMNGEEIGRLRLLLPLVAETPRDVRDKLSRLAELATRDALER